jgi:hypothetical protein
MGKKFEYINLPNLYYLTEGISLKVSECAGVIDAVLVSLNGQTGFPDKVVAWNQKNPVSRPPLSFPGGRLIVDTTQSVGKEKGILYVAQVLVKKDEKEAAPVVFIGLNSWTLNIPMRVEIPLRAIIKGGGDLRGTYSVYLHVLLSDDDKEFVYYGITKRGWNNRFEEHMGSALRDGSRRLFPSKLKELCEARADQLYGAVADPDTDRDSTGSTW